MLTAGDANDAGLPQKPRVLACLGARLKGRAHIAVLVHPPQGFAVIRIEVKAARLDPVGHRDPPNWTARFGEMADDAYRLEHAHRARRNRAGPPIERTTATWRRIGRVDNDRRQTTRIERRSEREANHAATEDDHVRAVHRAALVPCRNDAKKFA